MNNESTPRLKRHLSPLGVWALSFGCSVGWGAFVMPGTTFLPIAGPFGTLIGVVIGAAVMFLIGVNYHFLMNRFPDSGGTFSFSKNVFGYDHAFLSSWFIGLVYLAIIWANCTALPMIFRTVFGDLLQFGKLYTIAGYDVYLGEVLLSLASIAVCALVCLRGGKTGSAVMTALALLLITGVLAGFGIVLSRPESTAALAAGPAFSPSHSPAAGSLFIVFLAPWAFAGFESVSQSTEEFKFPVKKSLLIMTVSLITSAVAYILLALVAASAVPEGSGLSGWPAYTASLGDYSGVEGMPVFNGVAVAGGTAGLVIFGIAAAAAILTGLVGNTVAASRLISSMARDDVIGEKMGRLNRFGVPKNAVIILMLVSLPIPFLGRSAIGWVVDINTIGVTIAYAYTSAAAFRESFRAGSRKIRATGLAGIAVSLFFLIYFLIPNKWSASKLATESYLMLLVWILVGFFVFYLMFRRDKERRIGQSTVVWVVLMLLTFVTSFVWVTEATILRTDTAVAEIGALAGEKFDAAAVRAEIEGASAAVIRNTVVIFAVTVVCMLVIFRIYSRVRRSRETAEEGKTAAEESSQAKTTFLSNMSHDIRTPMNAIVGYVALAKREKDLTPAVQNYLSKIEASSDHLLALINDVLEMSRIESGKMELAPVPTDLCRLMEDVKNLFSTQMETKGLRYEVDCAGVSDSRVLCDANRLNRVFLNLVSNAYKFTPEGGEVRVTLTQTGKEEGKASFRLSVKDTGIGMSPEFAAKVFEAYERERTSAVENIQGTGLGTAITKSIVDLMGGTIRVFSEKGKGSEFVIDLSFPLDPEAAPASAARAENAGGSAFAGMRLLLVEDDPDNLDVAKTVFEDLGFTVDSAVNGEDAVERIAASPAGKYAAVIMDIEMPVKNGYEAARLIRSLKNPALAKIPIAALSAKAFSEDIAAARAAGMNAHIAKPINVEALKKTLSELLF